MNSIHECATLPHQPPGWLVIQTVGVASDGNLDNLDPGERAAIMLALARGADLIVIDDLLARQMASSLHLRVTGLLGVLDEAARQKLVDFPGSDRSSATNHISSLVQVDSVTFAAPPSGRQTVIVTSSKFWTAFALIFNF